jgi:signal transduction histidine kinase
MHERAEALGGWVHVDSAEGKGTAIEVWLPEKPETVLARPAA